MPASLISAGANASPNLPGQIKDFGPAGREEFTDVNLDDFKPPAGGGSGNSHAGHMAHPNSLGVGRMP